MLSFFVKVYKKIGKGWNKFIADLKTKTTDDEPNLILLKDFASVLFKNGIKLSEEQLE